MHILVIEDEPALRRQLFERIAQGGLRRGNPIAPRHVWS